MGDPHTPDPRVLEPGICGLTRITGDTEWVCIKKVHGLAYTRRRSDRTHRAGNIITNDTPSGLAHYFVSKYPYRSRRERTDDDAR